QISLEECGKADLLCTSVHVLLDGGEIDMKRLVRTFSRHEAKNKANAYFLPKSAAEAAAKRDDDIEAAHAAFKGMQDEFHKDSNGLKNAALYVDFDGHFVAPREIISGEQLDDIRQRNAKFMAMTYDKVCLLAKWSTNLDSAADELAQMSKALGIDAVD